MALVFVPRRSPNPIQDYQIQQMLAGYDPNSYTPQFPSRSCDESAQRSTVPEEEVGR
jgi:hypothetical protein